jgi:hypothetical protein
MQKKHFLKKLLLLAFLLFSSLACTLSLFDINLPTFDKDSAPTEETSAPPPTETPVPSAETRITVHIPAPLGEGDVLAISILDEVTGLPFNVANYPLQAVDAQTYTASLPLPMNAVVKYRYIILGNHRAQETTSDDLPVRYRLYKVDGIGMIEDSVAAWTGQNYTGAIGHIQGLVIDSLSGQPIPNLLISAGGIQTLTDSAGQFYLEGLQPGLHRLTAYAMDGAYQPFQQGAQVEAGLVTPVQFFVAPAKMVSVTFIVSLPKNTVEGAPVHIAGNLLQLGNTFGDLSGGLNTVSSRMPTMNLMADGRYSLTLQLPVGTDLRYKYTLGDGFWNAEHKKSGEHRIRRMIVPENDVIIEDKVETWQAGPSSAIAFDVTVPANTPAGDVVYIQFSPYAWTEPIPMWAMGNNHWAYKLYGPFDILNNFSYRYCRNAQCGSADDTATRGNATVGRQITTSLAPQDIRDTVKSWVWLEENNYTLVSAPIQARGEEFVAGIEFQANYAPNWINFTSQAIQNVQGLHANWLVLTPTWSYSRTQPLVFSVQPAKDPLWNDTRLMIEESRALNLNTAIFPTPKFPASADDWWQAAPRDFAWWNEWFEHYRQFALHYADMATRYDAQVLILGGDWLTPAMQNGLLADGQPSGVPADAELRWNAIITDIRAHFSGEIWWAIPYSGGDLNNAPTFIDNVDGVYLLWNAPFSVGGSTDKETMLAETSRLLDEEVFTYQTHVEKKIVLGFAVPAAVGAESGCIPDAIGGCLDWTALNRPLEDIPSVQLSLQTQTDIYEMLLTAINTRPWIDGIVSRGYYPPVMLQDKSASVHGKPSADLLWYWYPRLLGRAQ